MGQNCGRKLELCEKHELMGESGGLQESHRIEGNIRNCGIKLELWDRHGVMKESGCL